MREQVYKELCVAYDALTRVMFDLEHYGLEDCSTARELLGNSISEIEGVKDD